MGSGNAEQEDAAAILKRIDGLIAARQVAAGKTLSDRKISKAATGSEHTLHSIRKGVRNKTQSGANIATLRKLAAYFDVSLHWLMTGRGPQDFDEVTDDHLPSEDVLPTLPPLPRVPMIGYVRAGSEAVILPLIGEELDDVQPPFIANERTRALEIRGDSLGLTFNRWLVFFDDVRSPVSADMIGRLCVLGLSDGRVVVKQVQRGMTPGKFDLIPNQGEPICDVAIKWAARVRSLEPRL